MQFADIKFEPVIDSTNGKPPEFNYTNEEFAKIHCPVIRFAFAVNGFSQDRLREFVQEMVTPDGEDGDPLFALLNDWELTATRFGALAEFIRTAHARTIAVASAIAEEDGQ
jgi:hypothetical protein